MGRYAIRGGLMRRLACASNRRTYQSPHNDKTADWWWRSHGSRLDAHLCVPKTASGMAAWRKSLFAMMHLNANLPAAYFGVPPAQVVEVGLEVEI